MLFAQQSDECYWFPKLAYRLFFFQVVQYLTHIFGFQHRTKLARLFFNLQFWVGLRLCGIPIVCVCVFEWGGLQGLFAAVAMGGSLGFYHLYVCVCREAASAAARQQAAEQAVLAKEEREQRRALLLEERWGGGGYMMLLFCFSRSGQDVQSLQHV
jgi:hypothetical protein